MAALRFGALRRCGALLRSSSLRPGRCFLWSLCGLLSSLVTLGTLFSSVPSRQCLLSFSLLLRLKKHTFFFFASQELLPVIHYDNDRFTLQAILHLFEVLKAAFHSMHVELLPDVLSDQVTFHSGLQQQ